MRPVHKREERLLTALLVIRASLAAAGPASVFRAWSEYDSLYHGISRPKGTCDTAQGYVVSRQRMYLAKHAANVQFEFLILSSVQ